MIYLISILSGAALWTLMEYFIHRYLGHELKRGGRFKKEHTKHHHKKDYFASTLEKGVVASFFTIVLFSSLISFVPKVECALFTLSFSAMYLYYEFAHRLYHVSPPKSRFGNMMRKHHFYHHFMDENMNHGVTTPFWDMIFGTYVKTSKVLINSRFAMNWLHNSSPSKYMNHYEVVENTRFT